MNDLERIEIEISEAKAAVELHKNYEALCSNKHFQKVITEGYFVQEAARLVRAKSAPLDDATQKHIDAMIVGIGGLIKYFEEIQRRGAVMGAALEECEATQQELLEEGAL